MPSGDTFVTDVSEGLDTVILSARTTREYPADVMVKLVDRQTLTEGQGTAWREFLATQLTAQDAGENDEIDNPQQLDGSVLSITPTLAVIQTFIGDRVALRLNRKAYATFGRLGQEAIDRKKDQDIITIFASATTTLAGTGVTLTSGHCRAAVERITADADEPGHMPIYIVLHGYGINDIMSEVVAGVGTYPLPDGYTQEKWERGMQNFSIDGAAVYRDGLIAVNSTPDARGGIFSGGVGGAIVLVQGKSPWKSERYEPQKGYGGWNVWLKDEYATGERSAGNWLYGVLHDATAPTS